MSNISTDELEKKIEAGEEVVDQYFDPTTTRVGRPRTMSSRSRENINKTNLDIPQPMLAELDKMADELGISRQAVIKMMLRRALDEHYIAKSKYPLIRV
ncbi:MAG: ribbon-helix-helix protein, CopG family [Symploca sp. SIO1C2]|nr:ribbon-helix-helix protein, CopG family [Symploca sp. SIO1C2]